MNKLTKLILTVSLMLGLSAIAFMAPSAQAQMSVSTAQVAPAPQNNTVAITGALTSAEAEGLAFMREEEKLARDVYLALYEKWHLPTFQNIAQSEQTHMDAVKTLLDQYGIADPATGKSAGVFTNATLQLLYNQLVEQGSQSLVDALRVGAAIEEIDIVDMQKHAAQTDKAEIQQVYDNLMRGSRNHLRSFTSQLKSQTGETYIPQHLSQAEYDAIVNSNAETGRNNSNGNQGNGWRGGRR